MSETFPKGWEMEERLTFEQLALRVGETRGEAMAAQLAVNVARIAFVQMLDNLAEHMLKSGQTYSFKGWPDRMLIDSDKPELGYVPVYASNDEDRIPYYFEGVKVLETRPTTAGPNLFIESANYNKKFIVPLRSVQELRLMPLAEDAPLNTPTA